jgi:hypothetical protein
MVWMRAAGQLRSMDYEVPSQDLAVRLTDFPA